VHLAVDDGQAHLLQRTPIQVDAVPVADLGAGNPQQILLAQEAYPTIGGTLRDARVL
jgi:hypothetical protein